MRFSRRSGRLPGNLHPSRPTGDRSSTAADDPFVKKEQHATFKSDLDAAKADYKVITYPGAVHAFTNPEATAAGKKFNPPLRYDAKANKAAEAEASKMFAEVFKK